FLSRNTNAPALASPVIPASFSMAGTSSPSLKRTAASSAAMTIPVKTAIAMKPVTGRIMLFPAFGHDSWQRLVQPPRNLLRHHRQIVAMHFLPCGEHLLFATDTANSQRF